MSVTANETSATRPVRSIGAVIAGVITVVALSTVTDLVLHALGVFPAAGQPMATAMYLLPLAYRCAFGVLGSYLAAWIAPQNTMRHALFVGAVGFFVSCIGIGATLANPSLGPLWYPVALTLTTLPCAWLGGALRARH